MGNYYMTAYVKPGATSGDGSVSKPYGSIEEAMFNTNGYTAIYLFPGSYILSGSLGFEAGKHIDIKSVTEGKALLNGYTSIIAHQAEIKFTGCVFESASPIRNLLSKLTFESCKFSYFDNTNATFLTEYGTTNFIECEFDMSMFDSGWDRPEAIILAKNAGNIIVNGCNFKKCRSNAAILKSSGSGNSIYVGFSNFYDGKYSFLNMVDKFAAIKVEVPAGDSECSLVIEYCNFIDIPRALWITKEDGVTTEGAGIKFGTEYDSKLFEDAVVIRNNFIRNRITVDSRVKSKVLFVNNNIVSGAFGISAIDLASVEIVNSIIYELTGATAKDSTMPMTFPYDRSIGYTSNYGNIVISYSCLYNNTYDEFFNGGKATATRGPSVRFIDPMFADVLNNDFTLVSSSPLVDSGTDILSNFLGARSDIGSAETLSANSTEVDSYININRSSDLKSPLTEMDAIDYLKTRLKEEYVSINTDNGSVVSDLLIKPLSVMLDPVLESIKSLYYSQSLLNAKDMTEAEMDRLIANYFMTRRQSRKTYGTVRIFLLAPTDFTVPAGSSFSTDSGLVFTNAVEYIFTKDEMSYNKESVNGYYYADILVESDTVGSDSDIVPNSITSCSLANSLIINVSNPFGFHKGIDKETNEELAIRAKNFVSSRSLTNDKSIKAMLMNKYDSISDVKVIGFGDAEMLRDCIAVFDGHIGGCIDIYVKANVLHESSFVFDVDSSMKVRIMPEVNKYRPIIYIKDVYRIDKVTGEKIGSVQPDSYNYYSSDPNLRYSNKEDLYFVINDASLIGSTLKVDFYGAPIVNEIQDFVQSRANRAVCADVLAKHFIPAVVNISFSYYANAEITDIVDKVKEFIYNIDVEENELSIYKLEVFLKELGVQRMDQVLSANVKIYNANDAGYSSNIVTDTLSLSRVTRFMPGEININYTRR